MYQSINTLRILLDSELCIIYIDCQGAEFTSNRHNTYTQLYIFVVQTIRCYPGKLLLQSNCCHPGKLFLNRKSSHHMYQRAKAANWNFSRFIKHYLFAV